MNLAGLALVDLLNLDIIWTREQIQYVDVFSKWVYLSKYACDNLKIDYKPLVLI